MYVSSRLSLYIGRQFFVWFLIMCLGLAGIVFIFDFIELLRRATTKDAATAGILIQMGLLKLPSMIELLIPFSILFGSMAAFFKLTRTQELIVARAAGVSVWQFLFPCVLIAFLTGLVILTVFNPIAAAFLSRYEQLETRYLENGSNQITVMQDSVWLRQSLDNQQAIIRASHFSQQQMVLHNVTVYRYVNEDEFVERWDALNARLGDGLWLFEDLTATNLEGRRGFFASKQMPTDLTRETIIDSFAAPASLSFWQLPGFISILEKAGFSAIRHKLHLNSLITKPILFCAMVLIAASFSLRPPRRGRTLIMIVGGLSVGFLLFFLSDLVSALGLSSKIPLMLAAWAPTVIATLMGTAFLLHLEDG